MNASTKYSLIAVMIFAVHHDQARIFLVEEQALNEFLISVNCSYDAFRVLFTGSCTDRVTLTFKQTNKQTLLHTSVVHECMTRKIQNKQKIGGAYDFLNLSSFVDCKGFL